MIRKLILVVLWYTVLLLSWIILYILSERIILLVHTPRTIRFEYGILLKVVSTSFLPHFILSTLLILLTKKLKTAVYCLVIISFCLVIYHYFIFSAHPLRQLHLTLINIVILFMSIIPLIKNQIIAKNDPSL